MLLAHTTYLAGGSGPWRIDTITPTMGETLPVAERLAFSEEPVQAGRCGQCPRRTSPLRVQRRRASVVVTRSANA